MQTHSEGSIRKVLRLEAKTYNLTVLNRCIRRHSKICCTSSLFKTLCLIGLIMRPRGPPNNTSLQWKKQVLQLLHIQHKPVGLVEERRLPSLTALDTQILLSNQQHHCGSAANAAKYSPGLGLLCDLTCCIRQSVRSEQASAKYPPQECLSVFAKIASEPTLKPAKPPKKGFRGFG